MSTSSSVASTDSVGCVCTLAATAAAPRGAPTSSSPHIGAAAGVAAADGSPAQNTAGAPNAVHDATRDGLTVPRCTSSSVSTAARDPPSEWPASATVAYGDVAACCRTSGARSSYNCSAASYTPRCTRTPSDASSNTTGSNARLIALRHEGRGWGT
eukprot:357713-Chlamydomonas_euryale.AAC.12